jgi:hypothetical protein
MNKSDRRYSPRYAMKTLIRFREMETLSESDGYMGETTDISRTGVFFVTNVPLQLGSVLLLALRVPRELSGRATSEVQCVGRVVRMEYRLDGCIGYGIRIDLRHGAGAVKETCEMVEAVAGGKLY